ncbi:MAG: glycerate kinase type-2 family protein [Chloroflexota bacterium]
MDASPFFTHSLQDGRVARILSTALEAVEPGAAVRRYLESHPLPPARRVFALGLGKAATPMTQALSRFAHLTRALVVTKHASSLTDVPASTTVPSMGIIESGHPVPDARSLAAGEAALEFVSALQADDLLVCLISGGGSALMTAPLVPLEDLQALTSALLACGARIDEINTLRRRLDRVKGGGIAKATQARVLSLILSDVVGSPLEAIASGPTAPDPTTKEDALAALEKYGLSTNAQRARCLHRSSRNVKKISENSRKLADSLPRSILYSLLSAPETPKPGDPLFARVQNVIVGDNALAVRAALEQAKKEGFRAIDLGSDWQGEARQVGVELVRRLRSAATENPSPVCMVAGGETTVTLTGGGKGGRNQELALAAVPELADAPDLMLVSLATDGEDGPTDAAGAASSGETRQRAERLGLTAAGHLSRNDAYPFFEALGDLLKIGPTGTNVNDLVVLLKF